MSPVLLSLEVGLLVALLGALPAIALGWLLARRRFVGHGLLSALVLLPLVLPPVVTGLLLLDLFGRNAPLGRLFTALGLPLSFSFAAAVLAALVVGLPLYVWSARTAFEAIDPRYEQLALTLGDTPRSAFRRVTLPLALPGLAAGALLTAARALGEFGATAIVAGNLPGETQTISLAVYHLLESPDGAAAARPLVAASLLSALAAALGFERLVRWQRKRLELDDA